jgi:hypothetical protein
MRIVLVLYLLPESLLKLLLDFSKFAEFSSSSTPTEKRASPCNRPYTVIQEPILV